MKLYVIIIFLVSLSSCGLIKESAKYSFKDGYYTYEIEETKTKSKKQYVVVGPDTIKVGLKWEVGNKK